MRTQLDVYDEYLTRQAEASFWIERGLFDFARFRDARTILDFGCGNAAYTSLLAAAFPLTVFIGVDANRELLDRAFSRSSRSNIKLEHGSIDSLDGMQPDVLLSRLVTMYLSDPRKLADWASAHVKDAIIIDAADDLFSVFPPLPLFAATERANEERIRRLGGDRTVVDQVTTIWTSAGFRLEREHDIIVQSTAPMGKEAMHHMVVLHAELATETRATPELMKEVFNWSLNQHSYLQYGLRARHFVNNALVDNKSE